VKRFIALAFLAAAALLPMTADAKQANTPCSTQACHARIKVQGVAKWVSPHRLSGQLDTLTLKAGSTELSYEPAGKCTAYFYGHGVVARLSVCGRGKVRMKLRAVAIERKSVTLRLAYRVAR
jgi:hypothetical protein